MWIIVLIVIIAALAAVIYHDTHNFKIYEYEVSTDKVSGNYTFVFLTDLHNYVFGKDNERLIEAIDNIHPDAVISGGDMFTAHTRDGKFHSEIAFSLLKKLAKRYPLYISNGNHEEKIKELNKLYGNAFERYKNSLKREGIVYLDNESAYFNDDIRITGLCLPTAYFKKIVKKEMEETLLSKKIGELSLADKEKFQLLIAHNPLYFDEYRKWGADLTVSGHVHGGIIRLPLIGGVISPAITLFPKYDGGKYEKDGRTMILSRGLGTHTIHVRLFNPGEVSVIRVRGN
ncbi:metallophosphoesterase [Butyrivibrio sp. CB08]|uniref:metallophosphoesterase n=1 Tax=Butyrivibrio sp. CB08 TaxID=2364879 RepID=UPI0011C22E51|nr:metallophosphoesterase [Butyrivibrio sp. CB08]